MDDLHIGIMYGERTGRWPATTPSPDPADDFTDYDLQVLDRCRLAYAKCEGVSERTTARLLHNVNDGPEVDLLNFFLLYPDGGKPVYQPPDVTPVNFVNQWPWLETWAARIDKERV